MSQDTLVAETSELVKQLIAKGVELARPVYLVENEKLKAEVARLTGIIRSLSLHPSIKENKNPTYWKELDIRSSSIKDLGYDISDEILYVTFRSNGKTYAYENVDIETSYMLKDANSIGSYFFQNIRHQYISTEVSASELLDLS